MTRREYEYLQSRLDCKLQEYHSDKYYEGILAAKSILHDEYKRQLKKAGGGDD